MHEHEVIRKIEKDQTLSVFVGERLYDQAFDNGVEACLREFEARLTRGIVTNKVLAAVSEVFGLE
jgi:hypothetical protein